MAVNVVFVNHKGGVGKTAAVANVGSVIAEAGWDVLLIDFDPQSNLTYQFLGADSSVPGYPTRFIYHALQEQRNLPQVSVKEHLYLAPNALPMCLTEGMMYAKRSNEFILADLLKPISSRYDFILIDCPPSLGIFTTNALAVANRLVVPMKADYPTYYGLKMLKAYVEDCRKINHSLKIDDIFFNYFDPQTKQTRLVYERVKEEFGDELLETNIRRNVRISDSYFMLKAAADVFPDCPGVYGYKCLTKELLERICGKKV